MDASVADHIVKAADEVGLIYWKTVNIGIYTTIHINEANSLVLVELILKILRHTIKAPAITVGIFHG